MATCVLRSSLFRYFAQRPHLKRQISASTIVGRNERVLANLRFCTHEGSLNEQSKRRHVHNAVIPRPAFANIKREASFLRTSSVSWSVIRTYAKKGKDKGGKAHKKVVLTSDQLEGLVDLDQVEREMGRVVEELKDKFIHQVTVRTSQGVFDNLVIKTPDGNFPLIQLGQVVQKSPQLIALNMAAAPQYIGNVKEALASSGLNINPQQDGTSLFLPLPKVTREHREALAKNAKMLSEKSKKQLRDLYSHSSKKIKAAKEGHSADHVKAAINMVEDLMHDKMRQLESMTALKQKELMGTK